MPNFTETLELKLTNMETDGDDLYDFDSDLNQNFVKIDDAITTLINKSTASGIPTSICTNLRQTKGDGVISLSWKDPNDTIIDGQVLCSWAKTIVVGKAGSLPETENDGSIIIESTTRNAYNLSPLEIELPEGDEEYYFRLFPVSVNGVVCYDSQNQFGVKMFEFYINPNNSDPVASVIYAGENANYKPAFMNYSTGKFDYGDWEKAFFMGLFRPCMLNPDGTVAYYLDPNNYDYQEDGLTPSQIASTTHSMNAMVEVGQIWISEETTSDGLIHVKIANEQISDDFDCWTHLRKDGGYNQHYYRAMFDGCNISNVIRSLSGQAICKSVAGHTQIAYAKANGTNWNVDEYSFRRLVNYLLILMGKSLDTQTVFGTGRYSGGSQSSNNQLNTGMLNAKGMFYGDNNNGAVKVFHIENWWGNIWKITNGVLQYQNKLYYKMCEGLLDGSTIENYVSTDAEVSANYTKYVNSNVTMTGTSGGYISQMTLVPKFGLAPSVVSGSSSTFYGDGAWWAAGTFGFARFGRIPDDGLLVGAFAFSVYDVCSDSHWYYGVSLSYKYQTS